jgi:hypothetical protein
MRARDELPPLKPHHHRHRSAVARPHAGMRMVLLPGGTSFVPYADAFEAATGAAHHGRHDNGATDRRPSVVHAELQTYLALSVQRDEL